MEAEIHHAYYLVLRQLHLLLLYFTWLKWGDGLVLLVLVSLCFVFLHLPPSCLLCSVDCAGVGVCD